MYKRNLLFFLKGTTKKLCTRHLSPSVVQESMEQGEKTTDYLQMHIVL